MMMKSFVVTFSCSKHGLSQLWGVDRNELGTVCSSGKLKGRECIGVNSLSIFDQLH